MNFSIHLDKNTASHLDKFIKGKKVSRNSIITEALRQFLGLTAETTWPAILLDYKAPEELKNFSGFEGARAELLEPQKLDF